MEWFSLWWSELPSFERIFWLFAIPATVLIFLQLLATVIGFGDFDSDTDIDADGDLGGDLDGGEGFFDSFPIFSIRNLIAFFAMFGWVGAGMARSGATKSITIIVALFAGILSMALMTALFKFMMGLASSGNVNVREAIGKNGEVYLPIPGELKDYGKVTLTLNDKNLEMKAVTKGDNLETGSMVKIVDVINNKLLVERL